DPGNPTTAHRFNILSAVSCTRASECVAVGTDDQRGTVRETPLAVAWNGRGWRLLRALNPGGCGELAPLSSPPRAAGLAVGAYTNRPARRLSRCLNPGPEGRGWCTPRSHRALAPPASSAASPAHWPPGAWQWVTRPWPAVRCVSSPGHGTARCGG